MRYCPSCGEAVSDHARFCPECGSKIPERPMTQPVSSYAEEEGEEDGYEPESYEADDYESESYGVDDYEPVSERRMRREAEEDERYYREDRKTMTVGIIMAILICVVGVGLYIVVSNMLKEQPEVEVGSGLGNKPVQVDTSHTHTENNEKENQTEQQPGDAPTGNTEDIPDTQDPQNMNLQATVVPASQVMVDGYQYQPCGFVDAQVSSVLEDGGVYHDASHMIDGSAATSWQEASDGDGIGDWARFRLDRQYSVRYLIFEMGNWRSESLFYANNRPETIRLRLDDKEFDLAFPDGMQEYVVELSEDCPVSEIYLEIRSVHRGEQWDDCCISEMTVYGY